VVPTLTVGAKWLRQKSPSTPEEIYQTKPMCATDTAVGVQLKQTVRALTNNIDDLDSNSRRELLAALQKKEGDDSTEANDGGFL